MPVRALIGAPSADGALGHRLARLCLETVLHTEDNWETHLQLFQKIQTLTDAPEGKNFIILCFILILNVIFKTHTNIYYIFNNVNISCV